jgi:hypothetical protein
MGGAAEGALEIDGPRYRRRYAASASSAGFQFVSSAEPMNQCNLNLRIVYKATGAGAQRAL